MDSVITPEWVAVLRRDMQAWDVRAKAAGYIWYWPNRTRPLKYAGTTADFVSAHLFTLGMWLTGGACRDRTGGHDGRALVPPSEEADTPQPRSNTIGPLTMR